MDAADVMLVLGDAGLMVDVDGDRLVVGPAEYLTDELRVLIRSNKSALLEALKAAGSDHGVGTEHETTRGSTVENPLTPTKPTSGRCWDCLHFARPGLADGYCAQRVDLPHVYGFMHALPADVGACCSSFAGRP